MYTKNKKLLTIICNDSPIEAMGGLGERYRQIIPELEKYFNIECFPYGKGGQISKTTCYPTPKIEVGNGGEIGLFLWAGIERIDQLMNHYSNKVKPDYVLCADYWTFIAGKQLATAYGAKLILDYNLAFYSFGKTFNHQDLNPSLKAFANLLYDVEKLTTGCADKVITCSEFYKKEIPWQSKNEIVAVPNSINHQEWDKIVEPYPFNDGFKNHFVYIGRLSTQKGMQVMADHKRSTQDGINFSITEIDSEQKLILPENSALYFVGGTHASDQYDAVVKTCKENPNKFHLPFIRGNEKISLMQSATAILMPSTHEPHGIVGLEAMAAGTPLITSRIDGIADYANDTNSIKCEISAKGIRQAMDKLLSMPEEQKMSLIKNAKDVANSWTWKQAAEKFAKAIYET